MVARRATATLSGAGLRYECNACNMDLTDIVRIRCAVCDDVDLCADCFAEGKEFDGHNNDHDYRIVVRWGPSIRARRSGAVSQHTGERDASARLTAGHAGLPGARV